MPTWISALANGILFTIPIWLGHFYHSSPWLYWPGVGIAGILVIWITAAKEVKTERYRREQTKEHRSMAQAVIGVENIVNAMKDEQERKKVIQALDHYYERIVRAVEGMQVSAGMRGVFGVNTLGGANMGLVPIKGPDVRDIIPKPQFGEPNDDVIAN